MIHSVVPASQKLLRKAKMKADSIITASAIFDSLYYVSNWFQANKPKAPVPTNGSSNQMNGNHETVLEFE